MSTYPLAACHWRDAHGNALGDFSLEEIGDFHKPAEYWSFGLLIRDDAVGVTIAGEEGVGESGRSFRGLSFIPRGMVIELILLGPPVRPKPAPTKPVFTRIETPPPDPPSNA